MDNEDCHYNTEVVDINEYIRKVTLTIKPATVECVVKFQAYDNIEEMRLDISTANKSHTTTTLILTVLWIMHSIGIVNLHSIPNC